jgi:hypothetical protein
MTEATWVVLDGTSTIVFVWLLLWTLVTRNHRPLRLPGMIAEAAAAAVWAAASIHWGNAFRAAVAGALAGALAGAWIVVIWVSRHEWWPAELVDREPDGQPDRPLHQS